MEANGGNAQNGRNRRGRECANRKQACNRTKKQSAAAIVHSGRPRFEAYRSRHPHTPFRADSFCVELARAGNGAASAGTVSSAADRSDSYGGSCESNQWFGTQRQQSAAGSARSVSQHINREKICGGDEVRKHLEDDGHVKREQRGTR